MSLPMKSSAPLWILGCLLIFHFSSVVSQELTCSSNGCPPAGNIELERTCESVTYCENGQKITITCRPGQAFNPIAKECQSLNNLPECAKKYGCDKNDGQYRPCCYEHL